MLQSTALHYAAQYGDNGVVEHLVQKGALVNCKDENDVRTVCNPGTVQGQSSDSPAVCFMGSILKNVLCNVVPMYVLLMHAATLLGRNHSVVYFDCVTALAL